MAIPEPAALYDLVRPTYDTSEDFLAKLEAAMTDEDQVINGYRGFGEFCFYIPAAFETATPGIEIKKAMEEAGWDLVSLTQQVGYMPTNAVVDFKSAGPYDPDVTGPSTLPWIYVRIKKKA